MASKPHRLIRRARTWVRAVLRPGLASLARSAGRGLAAVPRGAVRTGRLAGAGLWTGVRKGPGWAVAVGSAAVGLAERTGRRIYAFALMVVLAWAGYTAVAYLVRSVFFPAHVPAQFLSSPGPLTAAALRQGQPPGGTAAAARAPIGHYHGVDRWFQPDTHNDCTSAGCHDPLPHKRIVELRAFSNLHATFIACPTCHTAQDHRPADIVWVDTASGKPSAAGAPAILRLNQFLQAEREKVRAEQPAAEGKVVTDPQSAQGTIVDLLGQAVTVIGGDPVLEYLHLQIRSSEPNSPVWNHAVRQLMDELPQHVRGEYGAKLAPNPANAAVGQRNAELGGQMDKLAAAGRDDEQREQIRQQIHALLGKPNACLACHGDQPPLVDFRALGYSKERAEALSHLPLADQMQRIRQGEEFHLPQLLGGP